MFELPEGCDPQRVLKMAVTGLGLAGFLLWETLAPAAEHSGRLRHGGRNLLLALGNTVLLALLYGATTVAVAAWAGDSGVGLLNLLALPGWARLAIALLLLDLWLYLWHRANHAVPLLWRFHRVHHADPQMDVTTATRFHPGEMVLSGLLRLLLIPLLGLRAHELLLHDALVVAVTQLHHANLSLGRLDAPLRWLIVTPRMHQVHHSPHRVETDSNYGVLLSLWDRLAGTFRQRPDAEPIPCGLDGFAAEEWQTLPGMLKMGFTAEDAAPAACPPRGSPARPSPGAPRNSRPPRTPGTASGRPC